MAVSLEQFVAQLQDSGLIAAGELENFLPPKGHPTDVQDLARQLVHSKHLTKYQIQEVYRGRGKLLVLGKYAILDKIGDGRLGQIYKGQDNRSGRLVTITIPPPSVVGDRSNSDLLAQRVAAAAKLQHPNLIVPRDFPESGGRRFVVADFVEGTSLAAIVKANGSLSIRKSAEYSLQAANGLEFAHARNLAHGDVRPANLVVDRSGTVKLLGLGLLPAAVQEEQMPAAKSDPDLGCLDYLAPEVRSGDKLLDLRAEIYSLGCTLHYLLAGAPPFAHDTDVKRSLADQNEIPRPLLEIRPDVPQELSDLVARMLSNDPADRSQTPAAIAAALLPFAKDQAPAIKEAPTTRETEPALADLFDEIAHAAPPSSGHRPQTPARRAQTSVVRRYWLPAAVASAAMLGGIILFSGVFKARTADGTIALRVNQPNAEVLVDGQTITVQWRDDGKSAEIAAPPGKHRIEVKKQGFVASGKEVALEDGGREILNVALESTAKQGNSGTRAAWQAILDQPVQGALELPLRDALDKLSMQYHVNFWPDRALEQAGLTGDTPVGVKPRLGMALREALDEMLEPKEMTWIIRDDVIYVTTRNRANQLVETRVYKAVQPISSRDALIEEVTSVVYPSSWDANGGAGSIAPWSTNTFVISQTRKIHDLIERHYAGRLQPIDPCEELASARKLGPNAAIWAKLNKIVDCDFDHMPLRDAIAKLAAQSGFEVRFDEAGLSDIGLGPPALITAKLHRVRLISALNLILGDVVAAWSIDQGALRIISGDEGKRRLSLVSYDLHGLTPAGTEAQQLENVVSSTIYPRSWNANGGAGAITAGAFGTLEVNQSELVHREIEQLLAALRIALRDGGRSAAVPLAVVASAPSASVPHADTASAPANAVAASAARFSRGDWKAVLDQPVGDSFQLPLRDAMQKLSKQYHVNFWPDRALEQAGLTGDTPVGVKSRPGMTLREALDELLEPKQMAWTVRDDAIIVTTLGRGKALVKTRIYKVLQPISSRNALISEIIDMFSPASWGANGGAGSIAPWSTAAFAISQTQKIHDLIERHYAGRLQPIDPSDELTRARTLGPDGAIWVKLEKAVDCDFDRTPLRDAIGKLATQSGLEMRFGEKGVNDGGLDPAAPITAKLHGVRLISALNLILGDASAAWSIDRDSLRVVSRDESLTRCSPVSYDLKGLIPPRARPQGLVNVISDQINPASWGFNGGAGSIIDGAFGTLEVNQTEATHRQIEELLAALRIALQNKGLSGAVPEAPAAPAFGVGDPDFQNWMKDVAAMPAEQQVNAVVNELQEINPGFDGGETHKVEGGVVTELQILTDNVSDISPVRALAALRVLSCSSRPSNFSSGSVFSDLSPLRGMRLTKLECSFTKVADLSPLRGIPLTTLWLAHAFVANLAPLRGMQLASFACDGTWVTDLSPLQGMPLTQLSFCGSQVSDVSPLKGMPLTSLDCTTSRVSDLSPLAGMNLKSLCFTPAKITKGIDAVRQMNSLMTIGTGPAAHDQHKPDQFWKKYDAGEFGKPDSRTAVPDRPRGGTLNDPAFQKWMKDVAAMPAEQQVEAVTKKLHELNPGFDGQIRDDHNAGPPVIQNGAVISLGVFQGNLSDISPLRALSGLNNLGVCWHGRALSDLSPLGGMQLTKFGVDDSGVSDLSPLKGMKLTWLCCVRSPVSDLTPIKGMPITWLACDLTQVADLSPLIGMKLNLLHCGGTPVADLSPIRGMPITWLSCGHTRVADLSPLIGMPLHELDCDTTPVSDLSPLKGMPLSILSVTETQVTDLSPLEGMNLEELIFAPGKITKGMDVIRGMKSLKKIGPGALITPVEFWKKYDAGEFGKAAPVANVDSNSALAGGAVPGAGDVSLPTPLAHFRFQGNDKNEGTGEAKWQLRNIEYRDEGLYLNGLYHMNGFPTAYKAVCTTPSFDPSAFTVVLRFKSDDFSGAQSLSGVRTTLLLQGTYLPALRLEWSAGGNLLVRLNNYAFSHEFENARLEKGKWQVIACTVDIPRRRLIVFFNGKNAGECTIPSNVAIPTGPNVDRTWSFTSYSNAGVFKGLVNELVIYNKPLSAEELAKLPFGTMPLHWAAPAVARTDASNPNAKNDSDAAAADAPLPEPIAHFHFRGNDKNEGTGNAKLELANTTFKDDGLYLNGIYSFDGKPPGYRAVCSTPDYAPSAFTVLVRFKSEDFSGKCDNLFTGGNYDRWFVVSRSLQGNLFVGLNQGDFSNRIEGTRLETGKWNAVACSVDMPHRRIIVLLNGKKAADYAVPSDVVLDIPKSREESRREQVWSFTNSSYGGVFKGVINELAIYDRALSLAQLNKLQFPQTPLHDADLSPEKRHP